MSEPHRRPNEPHLIWSDYHNAWFRPEAKGYTDDIAKAGVFRGRGVEETRERKVYYDEARDQINARTAQLTRERKVYYDKARDQINARTAQLTRDLSNLADIEQTLKLFVTEETDNA